MGSIIRDIREQQGMTQDELAKKSGVSRTTISALENNSQKITSTKTLIKIAKALNRKVEDIFFDKVV